MKEDQVKLKTNYNNYLYLYNLIIFYHEEDKLMILYFNINEERNH